MLVGGRRKSRKCAKYCRRRSRKVGKKSRKVRSKK